MSDNAKQVELAKATLRVFTERGQNMADLRHVVHYFYDGDFEALGTALRELGYETRPTAKGDGVIAERHEAIGEEWRVTTLAQLCELADRYGVEYDGWEAAMTSSKPATAPKSSGFFSKLFGKNN